MARGILGRIPSTRTGAARHRLRAWMATGRRRLRASNNGGGRAVLVAVSGYGQDADRSRAREAGSLTMLKPVEFEAIQKLLRSYQANRPTTRNGSFGSLPTTR